MDPTHQSQCINIVKSLKNHPYSFPFLYPVDPVMLGIVDYFEIIKYPMDLGTLDSKLKNNSYNNIQEFKSELDLIWNNCYTYNPPNSDISLMAKKLKQEADILFQKYFDKSV